MGSASACDYVGYLYMTGTLVPQDVQLGLHWYEKAAGLGNPRSMYALGYAYQCGQTGEVNMAEALRWYERAALAGYRNGFIVWEGLR